MRYIFRFLGNLLIVVTLSVAAVLSILLIVRPILFDRVLERLPALLSERDLRWREETVGLPNDSVRALLRSTAGIFKKRVSGWYPMAEPLASALAVTNDGWFIAPEGDWAGTVLVAQNGVFAVDRIIHDTAVGMSYLKVNGGRFQSVEFATSNNRLPGTPVALIALRHLTLSSIIGYSLPDSALSPITGLRRRYLISGAPMLAGAAVADVTGKIIGLVAVDNGVNSSAGTPFREMRTLAIIPSDYFRFALRRLIAEGAVAHHILKAQAVELAHYRSVSNNNLPVSGTLVDSVDSDSPLATAGVKSGDIIVAVEGETIQEGRTFGEIIEAIEPGRMLTLELDRAGVLMKVPLTLPVFSK